MDKEEEVAHVQGLLCRTWQGVAGGGEVEQGGERRRPAFCSDALGDFSMGRLLAIHPEDVLCSRLHPIHTLEHHHAHAQLPTHPTSTQVLRPNIDNRVVHPIPFIHVHTSAHIKDQFSFKWQ